MERVLLWLRGYLVLQLTDGDFSRFLNLCKANEIPISKLKKEEGRLLFQITRQSFKSILPFLEKCGLNYEVIQQKGFVSLMQKSRKKLIFFLFLALFISVLMFSSRYVWHIFVEGESVYTEEEICAYIKEQLPLGTPVKNIETANLERNLREHFDRVAWISCEIKGTRLVVHMMETLTESTVKKRSKPCNIVAVKPAMVSDILVRCGSKLVEAGDEVKQGDVLISGVVNVQNEYEETIETTYVPADGLVYGRVSQPYFREISLSSTKKEYTGKRKTRYQFSFWGLRFSVGKKREAGNWDLLSEYHALHFGESYYLPVSLTEHIYQEYSYQTVTLSEEEAEQKQRELLSLYLEELRKKGVEILENNVKIRCENGVCIASGKLVLQELIGAPEEFYPVPAAED